MVSPLPTRTASFPLLSTLFQPLNSNPTTSVTWHCSLLNRIHTVEPITDHGVIRIDPLVVGILTNHQRMIQGSYRAGVDDPSTEPINDQSGVSRFSTWTVDVYFIALCFYYGVGRGKTFRINLSLRREAFVVDAKYYQHFNKGKRKLHGRKLPTGWDPMLNRGKRKWLRCWLR